jgi:hypothetical protein
MRKFSLILIILLVSAECFADTNSINEADDPPAYNECDGAFVESLTGSSMTVLVIFADGSLTRSGYLEGSALTVEVLFTDGTLLKVTDATALVNAPPAYNACDGAFIQSIEGQGMTVTIIFGEGVLSDLKIHGEPMTITISIPGTPEQKITYGQGIKFEQGIDFYGYSTKWKACPNAALLRP